MEWGRWQMPICCLFFDMLQLCFLIHCLGVILFTQYACVACLVLTSFAGDPTLNPALGKIHLLLISAAFLCLCFDCAPHFSTHGPITFQFGLAHIWPHAYPELSGGTDPPLHTWPPIDVYFLPQLLLCTSFLILTLAGM